jgi:hypothetical protein
MWYATHKDKHEKRFRPCLFFELFCEQRCSCELRVFRRRTGEVR